MLADCLRDVTLEPCFKEHPGPLCKSFAASFTAHFNLLHSTSHRLPQAEGFSRSTGDDEFLSFASALQTEVGDRQAR